MQKKPVVALIAVVGIIATVLMLPTSILAQDSRADSIKVTDDSSQNKIEGTIKVASFLQQLVSQAKITLAEASDNAADEADGDAIAGRLAVVDGFLVYKIEVLKDDNLRSVIVDAGNGSVLFMSEQKSVNGHTLSSLRNIKNMLDDNDRHNRDHHWDDDEENDD